MFCTRVVARYPLRAVSLNATASRKTMWCVLSAIHEIFPVLSDSAAVRARQFSRHKVLARALCHPQSLDFLPLVLSHKSCPETSLPLQLLRPCRSLPTSINMCTFAPSGKGSAPSSTILLPCRPILLKTPRLSYGL